MANKVATIILAQAKRKDLALIQGDLIAVDRGVDFAFQHRLKIHHALGDFDSISPRAYQQLVKTKTLITKFAQDKDQSDASLALDWAISKAYHHVNVIGFGGGRLDHYQAIMQDVFARKNEKIVLKDDHNEIRYLPQREWSIPQQHWRYFSLFTFAEATVSISGAKYSLTNKTLTPQDTFALSNEWLPAKLVTLNVTSGGLLLFLSK